MSHSFFEIKQRIAELVPRITDESSARDLTGNPAYEWRDALRTSGILSARIPSAHGGAELSYTQLVELAIQLAKADPSVAQSMQPHHLNVDLIRLRATTDQQKIHFSNILSGAWYSAGLAERGTTFRGDIGTRLTSYADGKYRLNGRKFYTTGGLLSDYLRITALDEQDKTVWLLIPSRRQGVALLDDWDGMGQRGTASGTTELVDVTVEPNEIFPLFETATYPWGYISSATQLMHCTIEAGIGLAALDDGIRWANEKARPVKESGVTRSLEDPFVQHTVGKIAAYAHAAEAVVYRAAAIVDAAEKSWWSTTTDQEDKHKNGIAASIAVAEAKIIVTQSSLMATEQLFEIGGASATLRKENLDRHWRNARTHTTHDPIAYKYKAVGAYYLSNTPPPNNVTY